MRMLVFVVGLALTFILVSRKVRGALLISILLTTAFAILVNGVWGDNKIWELVGPGVAQFPDTFVQTPDFSLIGEFNFDVFDVVPFATALALIVSVMLSDFFDSMGTVVGLGGEAGLLDKTGRLPGSTASSSSTRSRPLRVEPDPLPRTRRSSRVPPASRKEGGPG